MLYKMLLNESIETNKVPKLDLHGFSFEESNRKVKKFIIKYSNHGYKKLLVITGKGRAFSSGGDVDEMGEYLPKAGDLFYKLTKQIHHSFTTLLTMP